jgi:hypothetical protein
MHREYAVITYKLNGCCYCQKTRVISLAHPGGPFSPDDSLFLEKETIKQW